MADEKRQQMALMRYQWDLEKLSPDEYYQYLLTGVYPLSCGKSKNPADC